MLKSEIEKHADRVAIAIGSALHEIRDKEGICISCKRGAGFQHLKSCALWPAILARGAYSDAAEPKDADLLTA